MKPDPATLAWAEKQARTVERGSTSPYGEWRREMSALFTALLEGETKESLARMVCELREQLTEMGKGHAPGCALSTSRMEPRDDPPR